MGIKKCTMRLLKIPILSVFMAAAVYAFPVSAQVKLLPRTGAAIHTYLLKHIRYPRPLQEAQVPGTVHASYTIKEDGTVTDIVLVSDAFSGQFEPEIYRVLSAMRFEAGPREHKKKDFLFRMADYLTLPADTFKDPAGPVVVLGYKPITCTTMVADTVPRSLKPR